MRHSTQPQDKPIRSDYAVPTAPQPCPRLPARSGAVPVALLAGVRDEGSSLFVLRRGDARQTLRIIWGYVLAAYRAAVVAQTDANIFRQRVCLTSPKVWPAPTGINVNMMPFVLGRAESSLPLKLHGYLKLLDKFEFCDEERGKIGYLTIHESLVPARETQRRPGLHTESPGCMSEGGSRVRKVTTVYEGWGGGTVTRNQYVGGIFMVSNVENTCRVFPCRIADPTCVGRLGDVEHLRPYIEAASGTVSGGVLARGEVCWMTDMTPHEAIALDAAVERQFVRVVTSGISVWHSQHSDENPQGIKPGPEVKIREGNKFDQ